MVFDPCTWAAGKLTRLQAELAEVEEKKERAEAAVEVYDTEREGVLVSIEAMENWIAANCPP
jgi:hypothetical protein